MTDKKPLCGNCDHFESGICLVKSYPRRMQSDSRACKLWQNGEMAKPKKARVIDQGVSP